MSLSLLITKPEHTRWWISETGISRAITSSTIQVLLIPWLVLVLRVEPAIWPRLVGAKLPSQGVITLAAIVMTALGVWLKNHGRLLPM